MNEFILLREKSLTIGMTIIDPIKDIYSVRTTVFMNGNLKEFTQEWGKNDLARYMYMWHTLGYTDIYTNSKKWNECLTKIEDNKTYGENKECLNLGECTPVPIPELGTNKIKIEPNNSPVPC